MGKTNRHTGLGAGGQSSGSAAGRASQSSGLQWRLQSRWGLAISRGRREDMVWVSLGGNKGSSTLKGEDRKAWNEAVGGGS